MFNVKLHSMDLDTLELSSIISAMFIQHTGHFQAPYFTCQPLIYQHALLPLFLFPPCSFSWYEFSLYCYLRFFGYILVLFGMVSFFWLYLEFKAEVKVIILKGSYQQCNNFIKHERTFCISQNKVSTRSNNFLAAILRSFLDRKIS